MAIFNKSLNITLNFTQIKTYSTEKSSTKGHMKIKMNFSEICIECGRTNAPGSVKYINRRPR